jgi:hypothetical protein
MFILSFDIDELLIIKSPRFGKGRIMPVRLDDFSGAVRAKAVPRRADDWLRPGAEPSLGDVLADPLVHLVMRRDGVGQAQLRLIIAQAQACLRGDPCCRCAA